MTYGRCIASNSLRGIDGESTLRQDTGGGKEENSDGEERAHGCWTSLGWAKKLRETSGGKILGKLH